MLKLIISHLFLFNLLIAQPKLKHYDNWIFGSKTGVTFNTQDGNPRAINLGDYYYTEGTSSFSDDNGNLLYYIDLSFFKVYLRKNNGFSLKTDTIHTNNSVSNTGLFIQDIVNQNLVHLFTVDGNKVPNQGINYLLIDKSQDKIIVEKNLFLNSVEKIAAVYNEVDNIVWVLTHELGNDVFNIYKIDENGFDENAIKQSIGFEHKSSSTTVATGRMNFSPNGTILAVTIPFYDPDLDGVFTPEVQIFDFDPKTGVLSNPRELKINQHTYATSFSPNGKVLYVKVDNAIYQYDLTICDWDEMIDKKYVINTKKSPFYNAIERGPNGVIYCGRDKNRYLDAIQNPDVVGAGCQYEEDVVELGFNDDYQFRWGLPTVLNSYFTGDYDEPCVQEDKAEYTISYPSLVCLGDEYEIRINSNQDEEFTAEIRMIWPQQIIIGSYNSINSEIVFYNKYDFEENIQYQKIFEVLIQKNDLVIDTLKYTLQFRNCCANTVKNGTFMSHSVNNNINGYCKAIDYFTDLDFREDPDNPCPLLFTEFGQVASSSYAEWHHPNFYKRPNFTSLMLIGDPLPNVPQRAWYQDNPTRKGTRYKFTAYVCNVERESRNLIERRQLNFWLGVKNRNQDLILKRLEDVQYEDDWIELSDEFIAEDNTSELAVWVLGESPGSNIPSYGFAIDDISLIPIVEYDLESQNDTLLCEGDPAIKLDNKFDGEIGKIEWTPTTGLDDPSSLTPIANPTESTTYTLKITDKYYCEFEGEIIVEVDPCLDRCSPDLSVYLTDKEIEIGESFCINGVFIPECEIETYLNNILIYFEYDPRLLRFDSATTDFDIIPRQSKNILVLKFDKTDFIINEENEFSFCFTALLGSSKVTVLEVEEDESYNLIDFTNSNINFLSCDQPFRQIDLMLLTSFNFTISDENLMSIQLTTEEVGLFQFQIIDLNGRILNTESFITSKDEYVNEEVINIDLQSLSLGNYFIRMISPNGKTYTLKFVKD